jgi:hypothetical protein
MKLRCMAVRTITCRVFCAGSPRTSASTTSIIYAVEFPAIGCQTCSGIIRNSLPWDGSPSSKVCGVCRGPCGTRRGGGSFRSERRTLAKRRVEKVSIRVTHAGSGKPASLPIMQRVHHAERVHSRGVGSQVTAGGRESPCGNSLLSPTPISAPPASPSAATPKQPHDEQQQYRSDSGVDDRADHSGTEMDA